MSKRRPNPAKTAAQADPFSGFLSKALQLHQQGNLAEADKLYTYILSKSPDHYDALHMLGVARIQQNDAVSGVALIERAVALHPQAGDAWSNLGNGQSALGQHDAALISFDKAITAKPNDANAHYNRGLALAAVRRTNEALDAYDIAISQHGQHLNAHNARGNTLRTLGRFAEAIAAFDTALTLRPNAPETLNNRGNTQLDLNQSHEALADFEAALALRPNYPEALNNKGLALTALGRVEEALASYEQGLSLRPDFPEAFNNRGNALSALGRNIEAIQSFEQALSLRPDYPDALNNAASAMLALRHPGSAISLIEKLLTVAPEHPAVYNNLGLALTQQGRFEEAIKAFDTRLAQHPDDYEAHSNRGTPLAALRRYDEAVESYKAAISLRPDYASAHNNWGVTCALLNQYDEALSHYQDTLACDPQHPGAHLNESVTHLVLGDWAKGFPHYEWRWRHRAAEKPLAFACPQWTGTENLTGKHIILWSEQGLGDTLLTCRFAADLAARGAQVTLAVQPALVELLCSQQGAHHVISRDEALPEADFHCPLMSVPAALGITLENLPRVTAHLAAPEARRAHWQQQLGGIQGFKIGLCVSGNPKQANNHNRSMALEGIAPLLNLGAQIFIIQKDLAASDEPYLQAHPQIHDLRSDLKDFAETAAIMHNLDLIISVDTSVAHLAGALGRPVWILLSYAADWRYLLARTDSPWYPSATLYRQQVPGDWLALVRTVSRDISHKLTQQTKDCSGIHLQNTA